MESKILELLGNMQEQSNQMQQQTTQIQTQMTHMQGEMTHMKQQMSHMQGQMTHIQSDIVVIKESINRIEVSQEENVISLLHTVDRKVEAIQKRQGETDNVVDLLAAKTTRLEANRNSY
ncbi:MAG: hypothetical protein K0Q73_4649 [Paenibacillus sp.]|nr:hypothetical protein [Paenibacillus sp.]